MASTPKTLDSLSNVTTWAGTDRLVMFGAGYENDIALSDFMVAMGTYLVTNYATAKIPYLDGSNKIPAALLTASASVAKGSWLADNTDPVLSDGDTAGWEWDVVDDNGGTIAQGAGTLAINGATIAVGDTLKSDGTNYFRIPGVANILNGISTAAAARTAIDVHSKDESFKQTLGRQPSNGYFFIPDTDYISVADDALLSFGDGTNDFPVSISAVINPKDADPTNGFEIASRDDSGGPEEWNFLLDGNGRVAFQIHDDSAGVNCTRTQSTQSVVDENGPVLVGTAYDGTGGSAAADNITLNVNGVTVVSTASNNASYVAMENLNTPMLIGNANDPETSGCDGAIHSVVIWNRELSESDFAKLAQNNNTVDFADRDAGATQTSGTLTIGKRYRITTFVAGDDFTNVGAGSNATGVEFVATGTTPTTYTNSSTLTRIGAVASYQGRNAEAASWKDESVNELHGTVSGARRLFEPIAQQTGTWTPSLTFNNGSTGQTGTFTGYWAKISEHVIQVDGRINLTAKGSDTGTARIAGFPFAPVSLGGVSMSLLQVTVNTMAASIGQPYLNVGVSTAMAIEEQTATGIASLDDTDFSNTSQIRISGTYRIA